MTISLPQEMVDHFERVRQTEHRTRSELVREALRVYFNRTPVVEPTERELNAIRRGRAEIAAGRYVTLERVRDAMATSRRTPRRKKPRKTSR
jgi:predicted transcriptional regulator